MCVCVCVCVCVYTTVLLDLRHRCALSNGRKLLRLLYFPAFNLHWKVFSINFSAVRFNHWGTLFFCLFLSFRLKFIWKAVWELVNEKLFLSDSRKSGIAPYNKALSYFVLTVRMAWLVSHPFCSLDRRVFSAFGKRIVTASCVMSVRVSARNIASPAYRILTKFRIRNFYYNLSICFDLS